MKKLKKEESWNSEMPKVKGKLEEEGAAVYSKEDFEDLTSRGYGREEDEKITLSAYETLFLHSKGMLEVTNDQTGRVLDFQELLHRFESTEENLWMKYLIYRDLRSRGYVVRKGFGLGIDFRAYERGNYGKATASYLILGIQEGKPIMAQRLVNVLRHSLSLKKKLMLAVVNRRGEIVYYTVSKLAID